jgi:hypothetical protein
MVLGNAKKASLFGAHKKTWTRQGGRYCVCTSIPLEKEREIFPFVKKWNHRAHIVLLVDIIMAHRSCATGPGQNRSHDRFHS